jgi:hypothetical protein
MNILNDKSDLNFVRQNEIEQVQQEKQEFKLFGTYLRTAGLNLYCYNPHKDIVEEVEVKSNLKTCVLTPLEVGYVVEDYEKPKVQVNPAWDYFEALNLKNAVKRIEKFKQGKINSIWNLRIPNKNAMSIF